MKERFDSFNNLGFLEYLPLLNEIAPISAIFIMLTIIGVLVVVVSFIHLIHYYMVIPLIKYLRGKTILSSVPNLSHLIDLDTVSPLRWTNLLTIFVLGLSLSVVSFIGVVQTEGNALIDERKELRVYTLSEVYYQNRGNSMGENRSILTSLTSKGVTQLTFEHNGGLYENKRILIHVDKSATELGLIPFSLDGLPSYIEDFANDLTNNGYYVYTEDGSSRGITTLGRVDFLYVVNSLN